eukprot:sb/3471413/
MDNYCGDWATTDGLCVPQFIKLLGNAAIVLVAIVSLYFTSTAKKHLVRFWQCSYHFNPPPIPAGFGCPSDGSSVCRRSHFPHLPHSLTPKVTPLCLQRGPMSWMIVAERDTCNKHWTAALPSRLTFSWLQNLLIKGWKKPLDLSDIGQPPTVDKCEQLSEQFEELWVEEVKKPSPSLILHEHSS